MPPFLKGSKPFAVILCQFKDVPLFHDGRHQITSFVAPSGRNGLFDFWRDVSYGNIDLVGSEVFGWFTMKYSLAHDGSDPAHDGHTRGRIEWIAEAKRLATESGIDLSRFIGVIAVVNANVDDSSAGQGNTAIAVGQWFGQATWKQCNRCNEIAYTGNPSLPQSCAAGGSHEFSGSADYHLSINNNQFDGQDGWRWCNKCMALCYTLDGAGPCPGGGNHDHTGSGAYRIGFTSLGFPGQDKWKFCHICKTLSYTGNTTVGRCASGGTHDYTGSVEYKLCAANNSFNTTFAGHETGHCLGLSHSWSANPDTEYGDPFDIMSAMRVAAFTNKFPPGREAGPGLNAPTLDKLGWLDPSRVTSINTGAPAATLTLTALNHPENSGILMVRIKGPNHIYTVELRQPSGWDAGIGQSVVLVHELRSCYTTGQKDWRWCRKCQALTWNGQAQCPAGALHNYGGSMNYHVVGDTPSFAGQDNWRWCHKCSLLSYAANPEGPGPCPAGGVHDQTNSKNYTLPINNPSAHGQHGWKWCTKCQGLAYGNNSSLGTCAAGGLHDHAGSADYALDDHPPGDAQWRWCNKCQGLAADGYSSCVADGLAHDLTQSSPYAVSLDDVSFPGDADFRFCWKCNGLANSMLGDKPCKGDGGVHNFSGSGVVRLLRTPPSPPPLKTGQSQWKWCRKCALVSFTGNGGGVPCQAGGSHDYTGSPDYTLANFNDDTTFLIGGGLVAGQEYRDETRNVKIHVDRIDGAAGTAAVTISGI
jgi:hypothetical protein